MKCISDGDLQGALWSSVEIWFTARALNSAASAALAARMLKTDMSLEVPVQILCDACGTPGRTAAEDRDCQVFGELALLYSKPRTATVQFAGNTSTRS